LILSKTKCAQEFLRKLIILKQIFQSEIMSEASSHHYQGRQSALQVFKEFGGGVGDPSAVEEDDDDEDQDDQQQRQPETEVEKVSKSSKT